MNSQSLAASTHYLQYDVTWASIALLYYDWLLTFPSEVQYVWGARFSLSTVLYIFCRYALLANVLYLFEISDLLGSSTSVTCDDWRKFVSALSVFGRAAIVVTLIGRAYAVWSRNRLILGYLTVLGTMCVVADAFHVPYEQCVATSDPPISLLLRSVFTIAFETSVAIVTTIRTFQALRISGPWSVQKHRLIYLIFEEGILYFSLISILTTASVILDIRAPTGFLQQFLDGLTLPLSGALTARFILHLRAWNSNQSNVYTVSTTEGTDEQQGGKEGDSVCRFYHESENFDMEATLIRPASTLNEFGQDPVVRAQRWPGSGITQQGCQFHDVEHGLDGRSSDDGP